MEKKKKEFSIQEMHAKTKIRYQDFNLETLSIKYAMTGIYVSRIIYIKKLLK